MRLNDVFLAAGTDKSSLVHDYGPLYERYVDPASVRTLVEFGYQQGHSASAWLAWFATASVWMVDINPPDGREITNPRLHIVLGDMKNHETIAQLPHAVDLVVDDASHQGPDIVGALHLTWPRLVQNGWYVIEDLTPETRDVVLDMCAMFSTECHVYREIAFLRK